MVAMIEGQFEMTEFHLEQPVDAAYECPASAIAEAYLHAVCVNWNGESQFQSVYQLLATSRDIALQPIPFRAPDSVSPHAAGGRGIIWYVMGSDVVGYIAATRGGYRVPAAAIRSLPTMV